MSSRPPSPVSAAFPDTAAGEKHLQQIHQHDVESQIPKRITRWWLIFDTYHVSQDVLNHKYQGLGTREFPYLVEFIPHDRQNPLNFSKLKKWLLTLLVGIITLAVAFASSAYSGGISQITTEFRVSGEVATLGISVFVVGFAIGPLLWAPMSELYGRQIVLFGTYAVLTVFNAAAAGSHNIQTLIIFRFLAGAFGSSAMTNSGGVIADMFSAGERGIALTTFIVAPFLGPVIGPIVGGFVGQSAGWRWIEGVMAIFTGVLWITGALAVPETYSPVILHRRAARLSKLTGKVYKSGIEAKYGAKTAAQAFRTAISRPWILLFLEPIVLLLSIYTSVIYGTLYLMFAAFPIVYQEGRGWNQGLGGLAFVGVAIGIIAAVLYALLDNSRYLKIMERNNGSAPPEARLPPGILGSILLPLGLFWFAWTNSPSIHWSVSIIGTIPFGLGMVLLFLSIMNYLIDAYTIYAASVLAANTVLRSLFGAAFPLFTTYMYKNLGIHWASSIPAFLALLCLPFPFLFHKYGAKIREKSKYAAIAKKVVEGLRGQDDALKQDEAKTRAASIVAN